MSFVLECLFDCLRGVQPPDRVVLVLQTQSHPKCECVCVCARAGGNDPAARRDRALVAICLLPHASRHRAWGTDRSPRHLRHGVAAGGVEKVSRHGGTHSARGAGSVRRPRGVGSLVDDRISARLERAAILHGACRRQPIHAIPVCGRQLDFVLRSLHRDCRRRLPRH